MTLQPLLPRSNRVGSLAGTYFLLHESLLAVMVRILHWVQLVHHTRFLAGSVVVAGIVTIPVDGFGVSVSITGGGKGNEGA